jgi:hypothetical protein
MTHSREREERRREERRREERRRRRKLRSLDLCLSKLLLYFWIFIKDILVIISRHFKDPKSDR